MPRTPFWAVKPKQAPKRAAELPISDMIYYYGEIAKQSELAFSHCN
jgi:hypothetical protein